MKLQCDCGHLIVDQTDYLPYKARLAKDEDYDRTWAAARDDLAELLTADESKREAWVAERFPGLSTASGTAVLGAYFTRMQLAYMPLIYECQQCGRLMIERGPATNTYVSFAPSSGRLEHILASSRTSPTGQIQ